MPHEAEIAFNILRFIVTVTALVGNGLVILVVLREKKCRRYICDVLIGLLSTFDFALAFSLLLNTTTSMMGFVSLFKTHSRLTCTINGAFGVFGMAGSQVVLAAMALDRFIAVLAPMFYRSQLQRHKIVVIALVVIVSLSCATYFVVSAFVSLDFSAGPIVEVCSLGSSVSPEYMAVWSAYNSAIGLVITATYTVSLLTLRCRRDVHLKMDNRVQLQIFTAVSRIILLYVVLICLPSVTIAVVKALNLDTKFLGYAAQAHGVGGITYSATTFLVYMRNHEEIRKGVLAILPKSWCRGPLVKPQSFTRRL